MNNAYIICIKAYNKKIINCTFTSAGATPIATDLTQTTIANRKKHVACRTIKSDIISISFILYYTLQNKLGL